MIWRGMRRAAAVSQAHYGAIFAYRWPRPPICVMSQSSGAPDCHYLSLPGWIFWTTATGAIVCRRAHYVEEQVISLSRCKTEVISYR
jgi:hypothetical protein